MKLFFDERPDLLIVATVVFPPLAQECGCLPIAITAILKEVCLGLLGSFQSGRALVSLGHETLLLGLKPCPDSPRAWRYCTTPGRTRLQPELAAAEGSILHPPHRARMPPPQHEIGQPREQRGQEHSRAGEEGEGGEHARDRQGVAGFED